jgi:redox-sensitive bicupin YhaK (pirin superfamily)
MVSPGDLGKRLKPFVFVDYVDGHVEPGTGFGFHPHSGIGTLTYSLNSDIAYEDTAGQSGVVRATGLEWLRAGGGTWHRASMYPHEERVQSFQLWVALPPGIEDGPAEGIYVAPADVPEVGNVRVLLGEYGGQTSPIPAVAPIICLDIALAPGRAWRFTPPPEHTVAWAMVYRGRARVCGAEVSDELAVLDESNAEVVIEAREPARVLFGSAEKHQHPLVLGSYSVHTNEQSLARGVANIRAVGAELSRVGRM